MRSSRPRARTSRRSAAPSTAAVSLVRRGFYHQWYMPCTARPLRARQPPQPRPLHAVMTGPHRRKADISCSYVHLHFCFHVLLGALVQGTALASTATGSDTLCTFLQSGSDSPTTWQRSAGNPQGVNSDEARVCTQLARGSGARGGALAFGRVQHLAQAALQTCTADALLQQLPRLAPQHILLADE